MPIEKRNNITPSDENPDLAQKIRSLRIFVLVMEIALLCVLGFVTWKIPQNEWFVFDLIIVFSFAAFMGLGKACTIFDRLK